MNNLQYLEGALARGDSGLWTYEISNVVFNSEDNIEYWCYVEHYGLGYFSEPMIVNIGGEWK